MMLSLGWIIVLSWVIIGNVIICSMMSKDEAIEFYAALIAIMLWPGVFITKGVYWIGDRREEAAGQKRVSAEVARGTYDADYARASLHWKGEE
jgi:hypothetical protein